MAETKDLAQLRLLNLELLRQLWAGQDAMRQSVSILDSSSYCKSETPLSPEMTPSPQSFPKASCSQDSHQGSTRGPSCYGRTFLPPATHRHPEPLGGQRPHLAPSPATEGLKETSRRTEDLGPQETEGLRSALPQPSRRSKARVTFCQESAMPESSWHFRPYLGYDWIAGALDNSSQITGEPDFFFSTLQKFREANKEEVCAAPEAVFPGLQESSGKEEDHQCVYCYRVNRRLFPVPVDPGTPCRLCGISRDQRDTEARVEPAQVRVSIPLSNLDPPHQYQIHRRKSYDSSDTLALPRHCLLGWDILPPKSEKNSAPKNLDLWSSVTSGVQCQLSAANPSCLWPPTLHLPGLASTGPSTYSDMVKAPGGPTPQPSLKALRMGLERWLSSADCSCRGPGFDFQHPHGS